MDLKTTRKLSTGKKVLGISFIVASLAVVLLLLVSPNIIAKGIFGVFGFSTFIILAVLLVIGIALLRNARYTYPIRYVVYLGLIIFSVLSIFHLIFANKFLDLSYGEYASAMFNNFSAGGIVLGTPCFLISKLIYRAGAYVLFIILGTIFSALLIDVKHAEKQFKRLSSRNRGDYLNYEAKQRVDFNDLDEAKKLNQPLKEESPVLVSLSNANFRRPLQQPTQNSEPKIISREQRSAGTTRAEQALVELGLRGENSNKVQNELVKKQLQDYILTPSSIQAEPIIKENNKNENKTVINDSSINEASRAYQNTINPAKRVYNNIVDTNNNESQHVTPITPIRNNRFNRETPPTTIEPVKEQQKVVTSEPKTSIELHKIEPENTEKRSIKAEVDDIEARINSILDAEKEQNEEKQLNENVTIEQHSEPQVDTTAEILLNKNVEEENTNVVDGGFINNNQPLISQETSAEVEEESSTRSALVEEFMKKFSQPQKPVQETFIDKPAKKPAPVFSLNTNTSYIKPPIELLKTYEKVDDTESQEEYMFKAELLEETLENFKIPAKVINITKGPTVTRYEIQMPPGKTVKLIQSISNDIAMALEANGDVRIEAPIPGRNAVGIEVPNKLRDTIGVKEIISSKEFENSKGLTFVLGKDISGANMLCDITDMPHLLVAGSTGSGKSVCLNVLIISLLYRFSPEDLKIILIDPKRVEFAAYSGIPHLIMPEPIIEIKDAINAFNWLIGEMDRRYDLFHEAHVNHIGEYNNREAVKSGKEAKLPIIVLIVDELSNLMSQSKREVEDRIKRLTELARASGIHLIVATQRPSVDVITGTIKANLPSRIAFAVTSGADSKTILDGGGAENLLGKGDMLYSPRDLAEPKRVQCAFISQDEIHAVVEYVKQNNPSYYDENIAKEICKNEEEEQKSIAQSSSGDDEFKMINDPLFPKALKLAIETKQASVSMIQRRFSVGFARAARILDQMELANFVSPQDENRSKPRSVYITMDEFREIFPDET